VSPVKKGRHRRYEEARALKRADDGFNEFLDSSEEPCVECGSLPGDHKSWCGLAEDDAPRGDTAQDLFPS